MRKASGSLYLLFAAVLACSGFVTAYAQQRERFVISAKAGGINAVSGRTGVQSQGSSEWELLTIKDNLEAGDVVKTGIDGRVEMLLNPGSYMRVAENSEFELTNNSLENLEVRLIRGTAIVEATGADDTELMINITTPHTKMAIVRRGLYRVNVVPGDVTELIVRKGRVLLSDSQTKVKGGRKLIFSSHTFSMAKLEKADKEKDAFDNWSKERAETVAKANRRIRGRDLSLIMASFNSPWYGFSSRSSGIWMFNSRFSCFTFVPFFVGWGSPYGSSYSNSFYGGSPYFDRFYNSRGYTPPPGSSSSSTPGSRTVHPPAAPPPSRPAPSREPRSYPRSIDSEIIRPARPEVRQPE